MTERGIKSLRQLETLSGIKEGSIKKWKERLPACESVIKLALFFNVSTDFLLGLSDNRWFLDGGSYSNGEKFPH